MGEVTIKIDPALTETLEVLENAPLARQRLRELEEGTAEAISHDHLIRDLGLADANGIIPGEQSS